MKFLLAAFICTLLFACSGKTQSKTISIPVGTSGNRSPDEKVAYFAEGCFWHAEIVFQSLAGVRDAVSGYSGGTGKNPDYESVSDGQTGYAETVAVYYDPQKISYSTLVNAFFASQDPTQLNRQGNDEGTQYRSAAFYTSESEKQLLEAVVKELTASKKYKNKIVTQVVPFKKFYTAEEYHQEYVFHNPDNSYVKNVSIPDFIEFKNTFKGNFK